MKVAYLPASDERVGSGVAYSWRGILKYVSRLVDVVSLEEADVVHVSSDTPVPDSIPIDVYSCCGGVCPMTRDTGRNISRAKLIVTPSHWLAHTLVPRGQRFTVIPTALDLDDWRLPIGESEFEPGYVLVKGYLPEPWLLNVVRVAAIHRFDLRFVCLGWSAETEPPSNVTVIQTPISHERTKALMNGCALYVSPLLETGFIMCLEAWMCDKPVLAVMMGSHLEFRGVGLDRGFAYYYDLETFLEGLDTLVGTEVDIRGYVEENYSWPGLASRYLEVYRDLSVQ